MSIRPRAARKALSRLTAASLFLAAMAASTLSGTAAADQNLFRLGFPAGGHNPKGTPVCPGQITPNDLPQGGGKAPGQVADLPILASCNATISTAGTYYFDQINIAGDKASLTITEPTTTNKNIIIWASSIIENGGTLQAGTASDPYGNNGGTLTIYIYGKDLTPPGMDPEKNPGQGALCNGKLDITKQTAPCGIPWKAWSDNGQSPTALDGDATVGGVTDFFYQYGPLPGDGKCSDGTIWAPDTQCNNKTNAANQVGYFGYKVLAVSYGGTLNLFGYKGTVLAQKVPTRVTSFKNPFSSKTEQGGHDVTNSSRSGGSSGGTQNGNSSRFFRFFGQPQQGQGGGGNGSGGGGGLGSGNPLEAGPTPACAKSKPDIKDALDTGCSWLRLVGDLATSDGTLTLSSDVGDKWWTHGEANDQIVVTTTDYLPGHSELLTIDKVSGTTVTFHSSSDTKKPRWVHSGTRFPIGTKLGDSNKARFTNAGMDPDLIKNGAETRAAVALLTRSIRIVSGGDNVKDFFDKTSSDAAQCQSVVKDEKAPPTCYSFGAHVVFRQGFKAVQIQGVEFAEMGQPGKMGHYPLHFHMARQVPTNTFIKDSSINESMTRWIVLHSTQGVLLQRNVGYKSIGNGFFLENGTETDNKFYSNLGIFARAAVANAQNPRKVPGILADSQALWAPQFMPVNPANPGFPFRADAEFPTAFWITNGWNDFVGNMAAGTGACGSGYWFVPTINNDMADVPTDANSDVEIVRPGVKFMHMRWTDKDGKLGYAGLQRNTTFEASTPPRIFYGNSSTATMMSFQTTTDAPACAGAGFQPADTVKFPATPKQPTILEIKSFAPPPNRITPPNAPNQADTIFPGLYYPRTHGLRAATSCGASGDCSKVTNRCSAADGTNCTVTVLDHFTSSFTWAQGNVSAIWLRPQWYLLTNSVITDVQNGGVTFITGGDFTHSAVIPGYWALMLDSILVGHTQLQDDAHKFTRDQGPVNPSTDLACKKVEAGESNPGYCVIPDEGVSFPVVSYFVNQRLSNIYDGPSYQDSNIYLDITPTKCVSDFYNGPGHCIYGSGNAAGLPRDPVDQSWYLPNAAIGWKQPNGFFYPPAFHSTNLFFGNVGIRHYVIKPIFKASADLNDLDPKLDFGQGGTYITTSLPNLDKVYCSPHPEDMFNGFTSIDRQTELNDGDGTLTGLSNVQADKTLPPFAPLFPAALKQTISVNEDAFFTAPVETPECASNDGNKPPASAANVLPANACKSPSTAAPPVTAKTSPYDYVATVVFHKVDPANNWDSVCSSPQCYGVPLYRQYLAGDKTPTKTREWARWFGGGCDENLNNAKCHWPFIRMAGEDTLGTRETLTVNNGLYYLDTAVPHNMQKDIYKQIDPLPAPPTKISSGEDYNQQGGPKKSLDNAGNVFQPKETYFVFFLYAKNTTRQTYQIYVGKDPAFGSVKPARVQIPNTTLIAKSEDAAQPWVIPDTSTVMTDGIVSVTIDFSKLPKDPTTKLTELDTVPANGLCRPSKFCTATGIKCGSQLADTDPAVLISTNLKANAARACSTWAVKDLDCPTKGCLGFSFTLPDASIFKADATVANPTPHRRQPVPFGDGLTVASQGLPNWLVKFAGTGVDPDHTAGQCHYTKLPSYVAKDTDTECPTPDWVPQVPK